MKLKLLYFYYYILLGYNYTLITADAHAAQEKTWISYIVSYFYNTGHDNLYEQVEDFATLEREFDDELAKEIKQAQSDNNKKLLEKKLALLKKKFDAIYKHKKQILKSKIGFLSLYYRQKKEWLKDSDFLTKKICGWDKEEFTIYEKNYFEKIKKLEDKREQLQHSYEQINTIYQKTYATLYNNQKPMLIKKEEELVEKNSSIQQKTPTSSFKFSRRITDIQKIKKLL